MGHKIASWADVPNLPIAAMIGKATVILDAEFKKGG
jgi:hypothetical protein